MIRLGAPVTGEPERSRVSDLLDEGTLSVGSEVARFEAAFADFCGRDHAVAVASGSVALELALEASDVEPGEGVVISPYNCGAVLYSVLRQDMVPIFADIDPATANVDPDGVRSAISDAEPDVTGTVVTHLYGLPAQTEALADLSAAHNLQVINDFAQAPGAVVGDERVESFGQHGVCSFGATKNLTTAEGGVVVTDDSSVAETVRSRRSNTDPTSPVPQQSVRMNDLEAAIGLGQLDKYEDILERKRSVADIYRDGLSDSLLGQRWTDDRTHVYHGFPVRHNERDALIEHLASIDIESAAVYNTPLYRYQAYSGRDKRLANTESFADEVALLPIHGRLSDAQVATVVDAVQSFV